MKKGKGEREREREILGSVFSIFQLPALDQAAAPRSGILSG